MSFLRNSAPILVRYAVKEAVDAAADQIRLRAPVNTTSAQVRPIKTAINKIPEIINTPKKPTVTKPAGPTVTKPAGSDHDAIDELITEIFSPTTPPSDEEIETDSELDSPITPIAIDSKQEEENIEPTINLHELRRDRSFLINSISHYLEFICSKNGGLMVKDQRYHLDPEFYRETAKEPEIRKLINILTWNCALDESILLGMLTLIHHYCQNKTEHYLNYLNVQRIVITSLLISYKNLHCEDTFANVDFALFTGLDLKELNTLERKFLAAIDYQFKFTAKDLTKTVAFLKTLSNVSDSQYDINEAFFNDLLTVSSPFIKKAVDAYFYLLPEDKAELQVSLRDVKHGIDIAKMFDNAILAEELTKAHALVSKSLEKIIAEENRQASITQKTSRTPS
ncbi:MAG: cyclin [Gammaproteobacteria bacterium]